MYSSAFSNGKIDLISSGEISSIDAISCDVRKPSKKCTNGMLLSIADRCATSARSCASCTECDDRYAKPVVRVWNTSP